MKATELQLDRRRRNGTKRNSWTGQHRRVNRSSNSERIQHEPSKQSATCKHGDLSEIVPEPEKHKQRVKRESEQNTERERAAMTPSNKETVSERTLKPKSEN